MMITRWDWEGGGNGSPWLWYYPLRSSYKEFSEMRIVLYSM